MPNTTKTKIKVLDTSMLSFDGYPTETFDTLAEAMTHVAQELIDGAERFEIVIPGGESGGSNTIQIDARCVDFDEVIE